eukprot:UN24631
MVCLRMTNRYGRIENTYLRVLRIKSVWRAHARAHLPTSSFFT